MVKIPMHTQDERDLQCSGLYPGIGVLVCEIKCLHRAEQLDVACHEIDRSTMMMPTRSEPIDLNSI